MRITLEHLAGKLKAVSVIIAFIVGLSALIVKYYTLPDDVQRLSKEVEELQENTARISAKVDLLEKRALRARRNTTQEDR